MKAAVLVVVAASCICACDRPETGRGAKTTTSAYRNPAGLGAASRTIDNTGYVDNGGRTSEITGRSELSGMRATEAGAERPNGTPGVGAPIGGGRAAPASASDRAIGGASASPSGPSPDEAVGSLARASCDRETSCERVGPGRTWPTQQACMVPHREKLRVEVNEPGCGAVDTERLRACLAELRGRACSAATVSLGSLRACGALCAR